VAEGSRPEVGRVVEPLADQLRPDGLTVDGDNAAVRLIGEDGLSQHGHHYRVKQPGDDGQHDEGNERCSELFQT